MNWADFVLRIRTILSPRQSEAELDEELHAHLELQARKHMEAGANQDQAKRLARRDFGSLEAMKEQCRDERRVNWFAHLKRDLRYAIRMFRRDPAFSAIALLMLALGIGATVATFSVMDTILLKMLPVKDPGSLFRTVGINAAADDTSGIGASYRVFQQMRERTRTLADLMAYQPADEQTTMLDGVSEGQVTRQIISGNYFQVLGVQPIVGRLIAPNDDREPGEHPVAVISDRLWRESFHRNLRLLGSKIRVGDQTFDIIGVAPARFFGVEIGKIVDVWTPIAMAHPEYLRNEHFFWLQTMGRLHPGVSIAKAAAPIQAVMNEVMLEDVHQHAPPGTPKSVIDRFLTGMRRKGVPAGGGIGYLRRQYSQALQLVMALVTMVLLIACTNVANLLLAKGTARRQEIAIRLSLGAGRQQILQQLTTESILLASVSTALGLLIAHWATPIFVHMLAASNEPAKLAIGLDLRLLAFTGLVAFITVVVSGLVPALHLAKADVVGPLKGGKHLTGGKSGSQRRVLVATQIALSLVLVIGAALFSRTLANLLSSPLGFEPTRVFTARLTLPRPGDEQTMFPVAWTNLLGRVRVMPGVENASLTSGALFDDAPHWIGLRTNARQNPPVDPTAVILFISPDYFRTLGIHFVKGRDFRDRDSQGNFPATVIVNQAFARKFFGKEDPLGHKLTKMADAPKWTEIVGIVGDAKVGSLRNPAPPVLYEPYAQMTSWLPPQAHPGLEMTLQVEGAQGVASFAARLHREAGSQFTIGTVSEQQQLIDNSLVRERLLSRVANVFGALSLMLAVLGLYGVMNYVVLQRRQEIGIRMAVGAAPTNILHLMLRESTVIIFLGILTGLAIAAVVTRSARALLFGLTPNDPGVFITASCILLTATLIAALIPAFKASAIDPMTTLREE